MRWRVRKALCELQIACSIIISTNTSVIVLALEKKGAQCYEVESKFVVVVVLERELSDRPLLGSCIEVLGDRHW